MHGSKREHQVDRVRGEALEEVEEEKEKKLKRNKEHQNKTKTNSKNKPVHRMIYQQQKQKHFQNQEDKKEDQE